MTPHYHRYRARVARLKAAIRADIAPPPSSQHSSSELGRLGTPAAEQAEASISAQHAALKKLVEVVQKDIKDMRAMLRCASPTHSL